MGEQEGQIIKPYHVYMACLSRLNKETFSRLIQEVADICNAQLDMKNLAKKHNQRFTENKGGEKSIVVPVNIDSAKIQIKEGQSRLDSMIELTFLVNKVTKNKVAMEQDELHRKIEESDEFSDEDKKKFKKVIKEGAKAIYVNISKGLKSKNEKERKAAIKELLKLDDKQYIEYCRQDRGISNSEFFYKIKHQLLSNIIKELSMNPEEYKDYQYGFIRDGEKYMFAINIPGHLGTYQFHILPENEKEILYDIDCLEEVNYEFAELAEGNKDVSKMTWIFTKDDIEDYPRVESLLETLKQNVKDLNDWDKKDEDFRKILLYSILLGKDPKEELKSANPDAAYYFMNMPSRLFNSQSEKTIENRNIYRNMMQNLAKFKKIYISSAYTVDSKVAVESVIREALKKKIIQTREEMQVEEIEPGKITEPKGGVYLNIGKRGSEFDNKNMIAINADEEMKEVSVSANLSKLGLEIPMDVIRYANRVESAITSDTRNAYILASKLTGEQIYELCEELQEQGTNLGEASLSDKQLEKYGLTKNHKYIDEIFSEIKEGMEYRKIGNRTVAIYSNDRRKGLYAPYIAYANGADYCITMSEYDNGVQGSVQSNPQKANLPEEVQRWGYVKLMEEIADVRSPIKYTTDILNERTRIVIGGKSRPNLFLKDRRKAKNKKEQGYLQVIIDEILLQIEKSEERNGHVEQSEQESVCNGLIEETLSKVSQKQINIFDQEIIDQQSLQKNGQQKVISSLDVEEGGTR